MNTERVIKLETRHASGVYSKQPIVLERGEGARVWDTEGREYIDCIAGHGVMNLGHAHPAVVRAICDQAARLVSCPNGFFNDRRAELLASLVDIAPRGLDRAYLCNSGAEAVEAAIKFARLATGRSRIVSTMRAFHGRTTGALSLTWNKSYREPFEPLLPGVSFVAYNRIAPMEEAINEQTAAVILEVIQGEGGVHVGEPEYLRQVEDLCRKRGALLVIDEIQTGLGRTGRMFACDHAGLQPDLLCLAKALGGGVPMGAVLIGARVGELPKKSHGSTFGGNPLACAAALATIAALRSEGWVERAEVVGARFRQALEAIGAPPVREVRGAGLMVAAELKKPAGPYLAALANQGVLALPAGPTVLRFLPPLVVTDDQLDAVLNAVARVLNAEPAST